MRVPDVVRQKALAVGAGAWLDDLPLLVASLEQDWNIVGRRRLHRLDRGLRREGDTAKTARPAVLKLLVPRSE